MDTKVLVGLGLGVLGIGAAVVGVNYVNDQKKKELDQIMNEIDDLIKAVKTEERKYKAYKDMIDRQENLIRIAENNKTLMAKLRNEMKAKGYLPAEAEEIDPRDIDTTIDGDGIVSIA